MSARNLKAATGMVKTFSDYNIDFRIKTEKKGKIFQTRDRYMNYLLFVLEGETNISYDDFRNHLCKAGEMVFIPQDSLATIEAFYDSKYILMNFNNHLILHEEMEWKELIEYAEDRNVFHRLHIHPLLSDVLREVEFYVDKEVMDTRLSEAKEKEIFLILKTIYSKHDLTRFLRPLVTQDMDFKSSVINNFQSAKNVEDLAQLCNIPLRLFTRMFKRHFSDSPYRWILKQRAKQIKMLLADSKIPMAHIIHEYGFSSPAHFTTYCKKQFGTTPSSFRKMLNGKGDDSLM